MKNGPTIGRHSSGRLYTTMTVNGKKKFIWGATEQEVRDKWLELRYMSSRGYNVTDNPTMEEYAIKWYNLFIKPRQGRGGAVKTKEMYINAVEVHIIPALGYKRIKDITTSDVQGLLNQITSSKSLQHKVRITLNQIFVKAMADRLIAHNPIIGTDPVEAGEPVRSVYTPEQRAILLEVLEDHAIFPLVFTILNTGMRVTEALALMRTRDLDLDAGKIYVREAVEYIRGKPQKKPPKTKRGVRTIPIPSAFADWLRGYLAGVQSLYVFPGTDGGQMGKTKLTNMQRKANEKLAKWFDMVEAAQDKAAKGIELSKQEKDLLLKAKQICGDGPIGEHRFKLHFRTLRHTYCTELFDLGIDELSAAKIMGHTVTIMREIYTHIQKKRQQKTIDKIENLYGDFQGLALVKSREQV